MINFDDVIAVAENIENADARKKITDALLCYKNDNDALIDKNKHMRGVIYKYRDTVMNLYGKLREAEHYAQKLSLVFGSEKSTPCQE